MDTRSTIRHCDTSIDALQVRDILSRVRARPIQPARCIGGNDAHQDGPAAGKATRRFDRAVTGISMCTVVGSDCVRARLTYVQRQIGSYACTDFRCTGRLERCTASGSIAIHCGHVGEILNRTRWEWGSITRGDSCHQSKQIAVHATSRGGRRGTVQSAVKSTRH